MKAWIFKYTVPLQPGTYTIDTPGEILPTAQVQNEQIALWSVIGPTDKPRRRTVRVLFTGFEMEITNPVQYLGTFQHRGLVFHVFLDEAFQAYVDAA